MLGGLSDAMPSVCADVECEELAATGVSESAGGDAFVLRRLPCLSGEMLVSPTMLATMRDRIQGLSASAACSSIASVYWTR